MTNKDDAEKLRQNTDLPGERTRYLLDEEKIPRRWYNIQADLPTPLPPVLHPATGEPSARPISCLSSRWRSSSRR